MTITEAHERALTRFTIHNADITPQFLAEIVDACIAGMEVEGFVMVPVEATEAMMLGMLDGWNGWESGTAKRLAVKPANGWTIEAWGRVHTGMIAARPRVTP